MFLSSALPLREPLRATLHARPGCRLTMIKSQVFQTLLNVGTTTVADSGIDIAQRLQKHRNMKPADAVRALGALAQGTRLEAFRLLVKAGPAGLAAGRIGEMLDVPPATLSFHLKELAQAGLVEARQENRFIYYSADFERMNELLSFLTQNCCEAGGSCAIPVFQKAPRTRKRA